MKKLLVLVIGLLWFTNFAAFGIMPNDPLLVYDLNRRLPLSSNPTTYFRDEYCWYFDNTHINTHVYTANNEVQSQFDEPVGSANIHAQEAWNILREATNTIIAVIDYGFDINHQDLMNNIYLPGIYFDGFGNTNSDISDLSGHGTMVLSVLAANGNNGIGTCGILWKAKILPIKITARGVQWVKAINYAIDNGAKVINISDSTSGDLSVKVALERAALSNIVVICSAPNSSINLDSNIDYPTSWDLPNVISVSNSRRDETIYSAAAYGANSIDIFAPGRLIVAAWPNDQYRYTSGTSFSAPLVSGVVALIREKFPNLTYDKVIDKLLINVDKNTNYTGKCISGGRLNAYKPLVDITLGIGQRQLYVYGAVGQNALIETSSDLIHWTYFNSCIITNSPMIFYDNMSLQYGFFRVNQIASPDP